MDNLLSSLIALETEKREICIRLGDTKQKISEKLNEFELIRKKKLELDQNIIKLVFKNIIHDH